MLRILPGQKLEHVIELLESVRHQAEVLVLSHFGTDSELARSYLEWSTTAHHALRTVLAEGDVDRLVTTRPYWAILSSNLQAPRGLINAETQSRYNSIGEELQSLYRSRDERRRWGWVTAAVLDTNVILHNHDALFEVNWHDAVQERPARRVKLVVPIAVVDELDRLKRSQGNMQLGEKSVPRQTVARQAIRTLDTLFTSGREEIELSDGGNARARPCSLELLMDPAAHERLPDVDAEIRERALTLDAFANRTVLLTYDLGNALAARWAGIEAIRLKDPEDVGS